MLRLDSTVVVLLAALAVTACQTNSRVIEPACANPARLEGHFTSKAPGFYMVLKSSVPAPAFTPTIERFEKEYGVAIQPFPRMNGMFFQSHVSPEALSQLRCDEVIEFIEFNGITVIGDSRPSLTYIAADRDV